MIGTIRKHQQWLWVLIIAATIVSFVVFFNPSTKYGGGGGGESRPNETGAFIEGRAITVDELVDAKREELLFYFLQHGDWPNEQKLREQNYQLDQRAYQRIALNQKAKDLGIVPTAKAAARMVEEMFGVKPGETVSADDLAKFEQRTLLPNHLTLEDFARFARHQAGNQQLVSLFGMSGKLITAKEAEAFYVRENEPTVAEIAYFPLSNYMAQVNVQPPRFVLFVNDPSLMVDSYTKYLLNQFREIYQFTGAPIEFILKGRAKREEGSARRSQPSAPTEEASDCEAEDLCSEESLDPSYFN